MVRIPPKPVDVPQFVVLDKPCGISGLSERSMHNWVNMWLDFLNDNDDPGVVEQGLSVQGNSISCVSITRS